MKCNKSLDKSISKNVDWISLKLDVDKSDIEKLIENWKLILILKTDLINLKSLNSKLDILYFYKLKIY